MPLVDLTRQHRPLVPQLEATFNRVIFAELERAQIERVVNALISY